ncbi:NADPH-dependent assimilatory sulfite reductase flavoprotein subunit [Leminorella grimontii]|uniref:NADPH-dependent assimilatory sulfite reductase flavoprotein subunit n=1 Tax=Leminorella grimontii TaxID=82981 RepID=UPI0032203438
MFDKATSVPLLPIPQEQLTQLSSAISGMTSQQLAWVSGYLWGIAAQGQESAQVLPLTSAAGALPQVTVTVLSASQTGNARRLAAQLKDDLHQAGLAVTLVNAADYKFKQIDKERFLVVVASTQGEGEPPEEAIALHKFLFSKKAPTLANTAFAVFGLGDRSYENFCQTGKDVDARLAELGADRLLERVDADVDYQALAQAWREKVVERLKQELGDVKSTAAVSAVAASGVGEAERYSREQPLVASLSVNQKITGRDSEKDVRHIEIDLGDSGLSYRPGDALGVWFQNDPKLIDAILQPLSLTGEESVEVQGKVQTLRDALTYHYELTQNAPSVVERYAQHADSEALSALINDKAALAAYAETTPIVDMVKRTPVRIAAADLLAMLRPLTPRLYSIASSQEEVGSEVHLTVGVVRYRVDDEERTGGASGYLADRLQEESDIAVFVEKNDNFRLPDDPNTPVVMIGPGTGIAPFRAFMQEREATGAAGKNWLLFGNPHFTSDFLYQVEWQRYAKSGLLTRIDLAWSRDAEQKVYVQDRLRENGAELWRWLQDGAHLYVCGDAGRMAKDVEQALLDIASTHGSLTSEQADDFLTELRLEKRYQRDVY